MRPLLSYSEWKKEKDHVPSTLYRYFRKKDDLQSFLNGSLFIPEATNWHKHVVGNLTDPDEQIDDVGHGSGAIVEVREDGVFIGNRRVEPNSMGVSEISGLKLHANNDGIKLSSRSRWWAVSFSCQLWSRKYSRSNERMYTARIKDPKKAFALVQQALQKEHTDYMGSPLFSTVFSPILYSKTDFDDREPYFPTTDQLRYFRKLQRFQNEHEYRLLLLPRKTWDCSGKLLGNYSRSTDIVEHKIIDIPGLKDIIELVPDEELEAATWPMET